MKKLLTKKSIKKISIKETISTKGGACHFMGYHILTGQGRVCCFTPSEYVCMDSRDID